MSISRPIKYVLTLNHYSGFINFSDQLEKQLGLCRKIKYVSSMSSSKVRTKNNKMCFSLFSSRVIHKTVSIILLLDRNAFSHLQKENRFSTEASRTHIETRTHSNTLLMCDGNNECWKSWTIHIRQTNFRATVGGIWLQCCNVCQRYENQKNIGISKNNTMRKLAHAHTLAKTMIRKRCEVYLVSIVQSEDATTMTKKDSASKTIKNH